MRRRRIDILSDDLKSELKSEAKGLFGMIVKLFLAKLIDLVIKVIKKQSWTPDLEDFPEDWELAERPAPKS